VIRGNGVDAPFASGVAVLQIVTGFVYLGLLAMYRRAYRLNDPVSVPPGG
jgi:hypothetical protein